MSRVTDQYAYDPLLPIYKDVPLGVYTRHPRVARSLQLSLMQIECRAPVEFEYETGKLLLVLAKYPDGIKRDRLLAEFYVDFEKVSIQRQISYITCFTKLVQRARLRFRKFGISVSFCALSHKWYLIPSEIASVRMVRTTESILPRTGRLPRANRGSSKESVKQPAP